LSIRELEACSMGDPRGKRHKPPPDFNTNTLE
jgi:hypothetical protein